jgi:hypothetical protein
MAVSSSPIVDYSTWDQLTSDDLKKVFTKEVQQRQRNRVPFQWLVDYNGGSSDVPKWIVYATCLGSITKTGFPVDELVPFAIDPFESTQDAINVYTERAGDVPGLRINMMYVLENTDSGDLHKGTVLQRDQLITLIKQMMDAQRKDLCSNGIRTGIAWVQSTNHLVIPCQKTRASCLHPVGFQYSIDSGRTFTRWFGFGKGVQAYVYNESLIEDVNVMFPNLSSIFGDPRKIDDNMRLYMQNTLSAYVYDRMNRDIAELKQGKTPVSLLKTADFLKYEQTHPPNISPEERDRRIQRNGGSGRSLSSSMSSLNISDQEKSFALITQGGRVLQKEHLPVNLASSGVGRGDRASPRPILPVEIVADTVVMYLNRYLIQWVGPPLVPLSQIRAKRIQAKSKNGDEKVDLIYIGVPQSQPVAHIGGDCYVFDALPVYIEEIPTDVLAKGVQTFTEVETSLGAIRKGETKTSGETTTPASPVTTESIRQKQLDAERRLNSSLGITSPPTIDARVQTGYTNTGWPDHLYGYDPRDGRPVFAPVERANPIFLSSLYPQQQEQQLLQDRRLVPSSSPSGVVPSASRRY